MKQLIIYLCLLCSINVFAQDEEGKNYGPKQSVKGILESGYTIGMGKNHEGRISFLATVGYQVNPHFFIGVGSGENYYHDSKNYGIPIYGDIRANILNYWVSPFVDAKVGTSIGDVKGLFVAPSVGCRFGAKNNTAFTISIGFESQEIHDRVVKLVIR